MYGNEKGVGEGIRASGLDRGDVYVTSKLNNGFHEPDDARRRVRRHAVEARLRLRRPVPDPLAAADALRRRLRLDLEDARGVPATTAARGRSACRTSRSTTCERLAAEADVVPAVNQIELHPYFQNDEVDAYGREHGIATEAWSPIAQGKVLDDPVDHRDRRASSAGRPPRSCCAGTSSAATSSSRSRRPRSGSRRTSSCSTSSSSPTTWRRSTRSTRARRGRIGPHPDRFAYVPSYGRRASDCGKTEHAVRDQTPPRPAAGGSRFSPREAAGVVELWVGEVDTGAAVACGRHALPGLREPITRRAG